MSESRATGSLRAVLFDMDGLFVDSEPLWHAVEAEIMASYGASWGAAEHAELVGGSLQQTSRYMVQHAGLDQTWEQMAAQIMRTMGEKLSQGVDLRPGALELVTALTGAQVPYALVSSSQRVMVDAVLDQLAGRFAAVGAAPFAFSVSGDDVTRFKPDPEPYRTALARFNLPAADVVVLEDSPAGVASGQAAGCHVVMVPSVVAMEPAAGRTVVPSLADLDVATLRRLVGVA